MLRNKDIGFTFYKLKEDAPIFVCDLPKPIINEVKEWVKVSRSIKDHPLGSLRAHENVGYLSLDGRVHNTYQCSIPPRLIEESFWLAYILRLCSGIGGGSHRDYKLRKWHGHFDGYDIWTNFAYKGDDNPRHNHAGLFSGVIYVQNDGHPTIFPQYETQYEGKNGSMVLFPSEVEHFVEKKTTNKERVTVAFNINRAEDPV